MTEREIDNRGSKSRVFVSENTIVKEQRVYDGWYGNFSSYLRCTLMDFERNYQIKIPSNQINKLRTYTTIATRKPIISRQSGLNPWFLTGFSDAESSFSILIQANDKYKIKWRIKAIFAIGLHKKDVDLLKKN